MPPLPCPTCGYDLASAPADSGACPECGHPFAKRDLSTRSHTLVSLALALIGAGTLTAAAAGGLGAALGHLPSSDTDSDAAQSVLRLAPMLVAAAGIGMLGSLTGAARPERRWPVIAAAVFATVAALDRPLGTFISGAPDWLQPYVLSRWLPWLHLCAAGVAALAGAAGVRRVASATGSATLTRCSSLLRAAAIALIIVSIAACLEAELTRQSTARPPTGGRVPHPNSFAVSELLRLFRLAIDAALWTGLGVAALVARALWRMRQARAT